MLDIAISTKAKKIDLSTILYFIEKTFLLKMINVDIIINKMFKFIIKLPAMKLIGTSAIKKLIQFT